MTEQTTNRRGEAMPNGDCAMGASNKARLDAVDKNYVEILKRLDHVDARLETIAARPSWGVAIVITVLSTICTGLIVGILITAGLTSDTRLIDARTRPTPQTPAAHSLDNQR